MAKLSQKELLDEGIAGKLAKLAGGAIGGTIGAVGGALKYGARHGAEASLGGTIGAATTGAIRGGEVGVNPKKAIKDAWERQLRGSWGGRLDKEELTLKNYIESLGYMIDPKFGIKGEKEKTVEVAQLNYDKQTGSKIIPGKPVKNPVRTFKSIGGGKWKEITSGRGSQKLEGSDGTGRSAQVSNPPAAPTPGVVTNSFSQKNLLRQLHMLRG